MEATFALETMTDEEVIDLLGGDLDRLHRLIREADERGRAFDLVREELTVQHPNKWIAWTLRGTLAVGDQHDDVLRAVDRVGLPRDEVRFAYLDPDPPSWKL